MGENNQTIFVNLCKGNQSLVTLLLTQIGIAQICSVSVDRLSYYHQIHKMI